MRSLRMVAIRSFRFISLSSTRRTRMSLGWGLVERPPGGGMFFVSGGLVDGIDIG